MSAKGDCYDNAVAESCFSTLEFKLLMKSDFHTRAEPRRSIVRYIEFWYNRRRRHCTLGCLSSAAYDAQLKKAAQLLTRTRPEIGANSDWGIPMNTDFLRDATVNPAAMLSILLHEVAHERGHEHPNGADPTTGIYTDEPFNWTNYSVANSCVP